MAACDKGLSRDKLLAYLWPESDEDRARNVLKQTIFARRRDLKAPDLLIGTSESRLNPEVIGSDVADFEGMLEGGEPERALTLYCGRFLDGFHLADAPEFERWAQSEGEWLAQRAAVTLEALATDSIRRGDRDVAVAWWRRLLVLDPLNARVTLHLMNALVAAGDRAGAIRHAKIHETLFHEELGSAPDSAITALAQRLRTTPSEAAPPVVTAKHMEAPDERASDASLGTATAQFQTEFTSRRMN